MKKLTLNADPEVIAQARRLAQEHGTSVSSLFSRFVRLLAQRRDDRLKIGRLAQKATGLVTLPRGKNERDVLEDALVDKYGIRR